jgi:hypothetical protein
MNRALKVFSVLLVVFAVSGVLGTAPANAMLEVYDCHDHPNGNQQPPTYGLRIDNLVSPDGAYTFSFDYADGSGSASVTLTYDDGTGEIHIFGRAYGGRDTGTGWDAASRGWIDIDFTYRENVNERDNCGGGAGNDLYVTAIHADNNGTVTLDGWGGGGTHNFSDKANGTGCSFIFDNDTDSKGNAGIANDPSVYSASGWLLPPTNGSRDWLFIAEMMTVPTEATNWGKVKALYSE